MALVTIRRSSSVRTPRKTDEAERSIEGNEDDAESRISKSLNECYFANKGAALVLGGERQGPEQRRSPVRALPQPDIQHHLQSMFYLVRTEETLKMAVKLESAHAGRTRYLVVVCRGEEAALLGIDCNERTTVGLVLRVLADTSIKLDGDGSALQTLHRASGRARELNHFAGGASHAWCAHYERRVGSDRSCLNEWHAMDCIESRRPPSPDSLRHKPRERDETERVIRCTLKEIMMSVDLDEVTSKAIRGRLEDDLDMDLAEYKSFIDQEMLTILGQMDSPTEIFDHVLLGSEWNASNLEELQRNGVRHILNVTREIDNFFPGMFDYLNIRVYDDDKTDLLKHWDNTFKYINKARNEGSKVLVHCKMGISRSASVVIAYAMKAFNWNFEKALKHVKAKRNCIKPNTNFLNQLETYQGILDAMKNKEKLQRSKSETNLKSPKVASKIESKVLEPTRLVLGLAGFAGRPRSWSPGSQLAGELLPPTSVSLESLAETRHMLMPCAGGSYSVSPNQIIRLRARDDAPPSVRLIVHEIENAASADRKDFARKMQRLYFGNQPEQAGLRSSDQSVGPTAPQTTDAAGKPPPQASPLRNLGHKYPLSNFEADKIHTWDPGESPWLKEDDSTNVSDSDNIVKCDSGIVDVKTNRVPESETFSDSVEPNIEFEDRRTGDEDAAPTSRQSSWSSLDSAVVVDLSRQSSWGSHERRPAEVPAAPNLAIICEHAPQRRGARLEDNERKFNETCAILKELGEAAAGACGACTWGGPLSASAPEGEAWLPAGLRRRRPASSSQPALPTAPPPLGRVTNLKREFEARSLRSDPPRPARPDPPRPRRTPARNSFSAPDRPPPAPSGPLPTPSGPLPTPSGPLPTPSGPLPTPSGPVPTPSGPVQMPIVPFATPSRPMDYADVVVSTVMSKAQNKKQLQHGKTHPLTRLNMNRSSSRCSNPVYNTM